MYMCKIIEYCRSHVSKVNDDTLFIICPDISHFMDDQIQFKFLAQRITYKTVTFIDKTSELWYKLQRKKICYFSCTIV